MNFNDQSRSCHAEPMRIAQGKLREASGCPASEILRCAQDDKLAQDDKRPAMITDLGW